MAQSLQWLELKEKLQHGHKGFNIYSSKDIKLGEDLKRRDITINSIAKDVLTGEIIDPFNGVDDINKKIIRATSKSFSEDPLRVYRVARFASKLGFNVDEKTLKLMNSLKEELEYLSPERVFDEFRKALNTRKPSTFFEILRIANVLDVHFSEIAKLIGAEQPIKYHPEGDAYNHTMLALDMAAGLTKDEKIRFSVLVHDLGKGLTPKEEYPHHHDHDINGVVQLEKLCNRLKIPNAWKKCGKVSCKEHMRRRNF